MKNIGPQMKYDGSGLYRNAISSDGDRPEQRFKSEAATFELLSTIERFIIAAMRSVKI